MTGVWPRGAQVRRVTGSSEAPDSSQNTMAARRRRARARMLGPVLGVEAVRAGTLAQRLVDRVQLLVVKARGVPGGAAACQRLGPADTPQRVPAADVLAGDAEGAGDLGLGVAGGEQFAGLHADVFERLAVAQTAGVAAVGGWSHTAILPGQPRSCHRKERTSF